MLFITIPDTRYKRLRFWYPITFIMCIIWIALSSYIASWMTTVVGDMLGIPDSIMGITFLAAGGNMPELVSIVILSRQGYYLFYFFSLQKKKEKKRKVISKNNLLRFFFFFYSLTSIKNRG